MTIENICVFCGSSVGNLDDYAAAARQLGCTLAEGGYTVVYGGASVGLMGQVADAALEAGAEVIGVLPRGLADKERAHENLTEMHIVESMHERKAMMEELADAFVALPGGMGTLEEFAEIFTWAQLGLHSKPCGLLNVAGYYDRLIEHFDHAESQGFLWPEHREIILFASTPDALLARFEAYDPPKVKQWIDETQT
jgi:hypothetical protein